MASAYRNLEKLGHGQHMGRHHVVIYRTSIWRTQREHWNVLGLVGECVPSSTLHTCSLHIGCIYMALYLSGFSIKISTSKFIFKTIFVN